MDAMDVLEIPAGKYGSKGYCPSLERHKKGFLCQNMSRKSSYGSADGFTGGKG